MIEHALLSLLPFHHRLVIPGLGAFVRSSDFSDKYQFNPFLRNDDKILFNYLTQVGKLSKEDAEEEIEHFIDRILLNIQHHGHFEIKDVGYLIVKSGHLELVYDVAPPKVPDSISLPLIKQISDAEDVDHLPEINELLDADESIPPVYPIVDYVPILKEEAEQPKKRKLSFSYSMLLIGVGLLASVAIRFAPINTPVLPPVITVQAKPVEPREMKTILTSHVDTMSVAKTTSIDHPEIATPATFASMKAEAQPTYYYVVVGVFSEESNADWLINRLNSKGEKSDKVITSDGNYLVSVMTTGEQDEALERCYEIQAEFPTSFVLKPGSADSLEVAMLP